MPDTWLILLTTTFAGALAVAVLATGRIVVGRRWQATLITYRLTFSRGLAPDAVTRLIVALSGLAVEQAQRGLRYRGVVFETVATGDGISHELAVAESDLPTVLAALRAHVPEVLAERVESRHSARLQVGVSLGMTSRWHELDATDPAAVSRGMLSTLQPLTRGERLVMQWIVSPDATSARAVAPSTPHARGRGGVLRALTVGRPVTPDAVRQMRRKQLTPLFAVTGRVAADAATTTRATSLVSRAVSSLHTTGSATTHLVRRAWPLGWTGRDALQRRPQLWDPPLLLNATELTALIGWPVGEMSLPGLRLGSTRRPPVPAAIPRRGRMLAVARTTDELRPLALAPADTSMNTHLIGPTGSGKSTLLLNLITQDIAAGHPVIVIDPKGDLVADVLDRVPADREADVVVLDAADDARPVGLNPLAGLGRDRELVVEQTVGTFRRIFHSSWGVRTDDILRSSLLTLTASPASTLCELPRLLSDEAFRRPLVARVSDPVALGPFWSWFDNLSQGERAQVTAPLMNKLRAVLLRSRVRNVLGQPTPTWDMGRMLSQGGILLVPLTKGALGDDAARLLGSLAVSRLWQAVQARASLPASQRPLAVAYLDEFQDFVGGASDLADVLAQARGLGLGVTLAHQHLGQLPGSIRDAVLANARSRVVFQPAAGDAHVLARSFAPHLDAVDLQHLAPYEVAMRLVVGGAVTSPVVGMTLPAPEATGSAARVREVSRARYGVDRADVERGIAERVATPARPDTRVGRREVAE